MINVISSNSKYIITVFVVQNIGNKDGKLPTTGEHDTLDVIPHTMDMEETTDM